jgi:hypothetical protein
VGVPLLQVCRTEQLRAILAHECSHYSRQHTRFGATVYRGMRAIIATVVAVRSAKLAGAILAQYLALYALVSFNVLRRMEVEADRFAVRMAGRDAMASALRELPGLDDAWHTYLASYVRWARSAGYPPSEVVAWFGWFLDHHWPAIAHRNRRPRPSLPWDTHPPIRSRLAIIEQEPEFPWASTAGDAALTPDPAVLASALVTDEFDEQSRLRRVALISGIGRRHRVSRTSSSTSGGPNATVSSATRPLISTNRSLGSARRKSRFGCRTGRSNR